MSDATRYPLSWPAGRARTNHRQRSRFRVSTFARVRDELFNELKLLGARRVVFSTNLKLRQDGLPLAGQAQPSDPGVAVYFRYKDRDVCFACDRWDRIEDNTQAVGHTVSALRGIARWGTGDMVEAAFTGFAALPPGPAKKSWYQVLCVGGHESTEAVTEAYRELSKKYHPDRNPGDDEAVKNYLAVQDAFDSFKKERGL
jgi:hypothetical protein